MRSLIIATAFVAAAAMPVEAAMAQQAGAPVMKRPMPKPGATWKLPGAQWNPGMRWQGSRWGGRVNGRWFAGYHAPGGWTAYRAPVVGWVLPRYWYSPSFYVTDWAAYGLPAPASGRTWTRYYDDAVLVDDGGRVYDHRGGVAWDRDDDGYDSDYDRRGHRKDDTGKQVAGAVIGGVVGGLAGSAIAGRGDKALGAVVGAGVGAVAGAAIANSGDKHRGKHRRGPMPPIAPDDDYPIAPDDGYDGPGAPYAPPGYGPGYSPPPPHAMRRERRIEVPAGHRGPYTEVIHGPGTVTTVTVIPATTTTTTTVQYVPVTTYKRVYKPVYRGKSSKLLKR